MGFIYRFIYAVLFCAVLPFVAAEAHDVTFNRLSTEDGLSQVSVNDVYVDENGLVWIGTREGLNRYDGNGIKVFRMEKDNPYSLFSNQVLKVTGDRKGHLYLLCVDGLARFDMQTGRFSVVYRGQVSAVLYHGGLYVGCDERLFRYDEGKGEMELFYTLPSGSERLTALHIDSQGNLWMGTEAHGLFCLSAGKVFSHEIKGGRISSIFEDTAGRLWVGTWENGAYRKSPKGDWDNLRTGHNGLSSNFVRCFCEDNKGNLWIGTAEGLDCLHPDEEVAFHHYQAGRAPYGLSHESVWCMVKDAQGTIWAGTYFGGVNYFNPEYAVYTVFGKAAHEADGLSSPIVGNMLEDKRGNIWICTEGGGLNMLDRQTGKFRWYVHSASANSISHNNVKAIWYDEGTDQIWLGLHLGGLNRLDIRSGRFFAYRHEAGNPATIPSDIVRDILPYGDSLVVATQQGVCLLSKATGKCRQLFGESPEGDKIRMVADLELDRTGVLWMAVTGEGAFSYNFKTDRLVHYPYREGQPGVSNSNVNSIFCDHANRIWFATSGSGLDCLDQSDGTFRNFDAARNGLSGDCIYKICENDDRELLLITNCGFSRFEPATERVRNYVAENGFPLSAVNENALFVSKEKEVFLGGMTGMVMFPLKGLDRSPLPYTLVWSKLIVNGKEILPGDKTGLLADALNYTSEITLKADQNMFSLYFSASNYVPENREQIEYKLEGFSEEWTPVREQPVITYTNLNPGTYTLCVRSANPLTLSKPITMKIVVKPPFYATWWAYIIYVLLAGGILWYLMRMYQTRVKLQASLAYEQRHLQDIERLNQAKLRFFTSISHEFRTPLTLIIGQLERLMQMPQILPSVYSKVLLAYQSSVQLKELISELLDFRKQEQGKMKLKVSRMNLVYFLNETYLLFQPYAESKKIFLEFVSECDDIEVWFDWQQMRKVINNLLSNAIKHVLPEGRVTLRVWRTDGKAWFSVEDTGSGISPKDIGKIFLRFYQSTEDTEINAGTGIGLALTKGIVELHHGQINVESTEGKGAKFTVWIPEGNDMYEPDEIIETSEHAVIRQMTVDGPKYSLNPEQVEVLKAGVMPNSDGSRPHMLIVEDNESIRKMLAGLFESIYDVALASDGMEALEKVKENPPQIVLSDVLMPRMSGIELVKELKGNLDTCHIPVVLLTARTEVEQNLESLKIGADDYITKPFDSRLLILRCNNLVNNRRKLQEYFTKQPAAETPVLATNPLDKKFLDEVITIFEKHLDDSAFTIDMLAQQMLVSRTRMYAKIKAITGQTPNDFFITLRLKKAACLLKNSPELNITQISDQTGFSSPRYFSKVFKKAYLVTPMAYRTGQDQ